MDKEYPVSAWQEWKIIEKIGEGSFGKVYKAERSEHGHKFYSAIKVIHIPGSQGELNSVRSETGDDKSAREYFQNLVEECIQEVSTMELFRGNSHIVSVEDFKVMEYLDDIGWEISIRMEYLTSFMDYCAEKQLTEKEVIQLGVDLSRALEYCHRQKILHRDIKPENIFVSRFGDFKLGDFGIARELERTMSGFSKKGTYSYMAPEMYRGEKYDSRVDIYSLGLVLYRLMNCNRLPFLNMEKQFITYRDKENALARRMSAEPLKKPVNAGEEFARIILKACAYDPKERYQTAEEFHQALDDLKNGRVPKTSDSQKQPAPQKAPVSQKPSAPQKAPVSQKQPAPQTQPAPQKASVPQKQPVPQKAPVPQNTAAAAPSRREQAQTVPVEKTVVPKRPVQKAAEQPTAEELAQMKAARLSAQRKRRRKNRTSSISMMIAMLCLIVVIVMVIYVKTIVDETRVRPTDDLVSILEDEKYSGSKNKPQDFATQVENIKKRATAIVDNLDNYDWIGVEGDKISYFDHDSGKYMKVLVYPASSDEKVYEEYYYWNEKLFFAYIWYDTKAELYYYNDNGELIRWIDEKGTCHDNETDNAEYVERGERYWKKSVAELE